MRCHENRNRDRRFQVGYFDALKFHEPRSGDRSYLRGWRSGCRISHERNVTGQSLPGFAL